MTHLSAMALFCEDIREEKNGIVSLMGILPDTVAVQQREQSDSAESMSRFLAKLCIYVRVNFDPAIAPSSLIIWLVTPRGERVQLGTVDAETIGKAHSEATTKGNILAGIFSCVTLTPFKPENGAMKIEVEADAEMVLAGALTFSVGAAASGRLDSEP